MNVTGDGGVEGGFRGRRAAAQQAPDGIEDGDLLMGSEHEQLRPQGSQGMEGDVRPAAEGVLGRVLPRLQALAKVEEVQGLPVVEGFIAVCVQDERRISLECV
jgi:hypothetical protein